MVLRTPPATPTVDQVDDLHGELVADPYRWLEDTYAPETEKWVEAQNAHTERWLATIPARAEIGRRLAEIWDYPRFGVPFERGGRWFQTRNSGLQNQSVLYVMDGPDDDGRVLLDPNALSDDGTVALTGLAVTGDGTLVAYATSSAGSDWMTWRVRDVVTGEDRDDLVEWSKFCEGSWRGDGSGFYYGAPPRPESGGEYLDEVGVLRVFFHRLGTAQAEDELVFERPDEPQWLPHAVVSEDGRFVVVTITKGTNRETRVEVLDLEAPESGLQVLVAGFTCKATVVGNVGATFYVLTNADADRQRVVAVELDDAVEDRWREVVPEQGGVLAEARLCGGMLVCDHLVDACSRLSVFSLEGAPVREIELPPIVSVGDPERGSAVEGRATSDVVHFLVTSFTDAGSLWRHDLVSGDTRLVRRSPAPIDADALVTEEVFVAASDGARVPLFITHRRDVRPSGDVPALLYGYGGFDIPMVPSFKRSNAVFVERGGLLAVAALRGGGEYGSAWHDAGRLANKQRVFDDFADCARWLASSGWSRRERIAINGGSNGGLLVGALLTQHPELVGAAVPEVGVLDMLRFHRFTIGWAWTSDYGDPDDPEQYRWVRAYSPLHNIRAGTNYPPTLVMTGDHDDRVVPGHSFKFAATLQAAQGDPSAPILIRVETSAGHGFGKPTSKAIAERTDMLAFVEAALGVADRAASDG